MYAGQFWPIIVSVRTIFGLLRRAFAAAVEHDCATVARGAAFSAILSFFPGLMVVASLLFSQNAEATVREFSTVLGMVLPPEAYRLAAQYLEVEDFQTHSLLVLALLVAIWSATDAIVALMKGFRVVYRLPDAGSYLKTRAVALALLLMAGAPLLFATLLLFFGEQIENRLLVRFWAASGWILLAGKGLRWLVAVGTSVVVLAMVYRVAPNRRQRWRYAWPGAAVATSLWVAATLLFAWYAQNVARYRDLYGSLAATVVLLLWMYMLSLIVLVGCEFNAVYERSAVGKGQRD